MGGNEQVCIKIVGHIWRYFLKGGYSGRRCWVYECHALAAGYVLPSRSAQSTPTAVGREAEVSPCSGLANSGYCHLGFLLMENAACCFQKTMYNEVVGREPREYSGEILSRSESAPGKVKGSCALARSQASARAPRPAFSLMLSEHARRENTSSTAVKSSSGELAFTDSSKEGQGPAFPSGSQIGFQARSYSVYPGKGKTPSLPFPASHRPSRIIFQCCFCGGACRWFLFLNLRSFQKCIPILLCMLQPHLRQSPSLVKTCFLHSWRRS